MQSKWDLTDEDRTFSAQNLTIFVLHKMDRCPEMCGIFAGIGNGRKVRCDWREERGGGFKLHNRLRLWTPVTPNPVGQEDGII